MGKQSTCYAGDSGDNGLILGLGRCPGEGKGDPLQYSWKIPWTESLEDTVLRVVKSDTAGATATRSPTAGGVHVGFLLAAPGLSALLLSPPTQLRLPNYTAQNPKIPQNSSSED